MRLLCAAALVLPAFAAQAAGVFTSLHSFQVFTNGANPYAGLVQGRDGNFYGTTSGGGTNGGYGTVFKISSTGVLTSLYSFTGGNDGANPRAGLVQGSDGNFYGTTFGIGLYNGVGNDNGTVNGTMFKISTNGALTSLYSFTGGNDGQGPSGLVQGSDGNFYGTTSGGGMNGGYGTVFKISTNGALTSLYLFTGTNDGANPRAGLVQGSDGSYYGTTYGGGTNGAGTVFKIGTNGALTSLYSFPEYYEGANPYAGLVQGGDGNFYGTSSGGGGGTVFRISTNGELATLHRFAGGTDGLYPEAGLVQGSDGNLYGTTFGSTNDSGTVFRISTNGALASLYSFTGGNDGANPSAGLVQGRDGNFYGTTGGGGTHGAGTVFRISTNGPYASLYSFTGVNDGANPYAGLVQGSDGNFYGTTYKGGTYGVGTVFKISANGVLTSLYPFTGGEDGANPYAGLVQGSDGNFYGTTYMGGTNGVGTVFKISANGALTSLYSFTGGNDGECPRAGLVQASDGNFYGTTYGSFFGPSYGTVFKISTNGALTTLHSFTGGYYGHGLDGANPFAGLVQGSDGTLYGTTTRGGWTRVISGLGTVFSISTNGAFRYLYFFSGPDGVYPEAGLVQGSDGLLYGTQPYGVFNISTHAFPTFFQYYDYTSLYSFTGGTHGEGPSGLVLGSDGSFYGTTSSGGQGGGGTVFRLTIVPEFQAVTLTNSTLSLTWSTEAGGRYQLQYSSDLSSSNWINLTNAVTAAGATLSATDSVTNGPRRFYRAVLLP